MKLRMKPGMTASVAACVWIAAALGTGFARAQPALGPELRESTIRERQLWRIPTPIPSLAARAVVYRPSGRGPFPLALIAHASTQNAVDRAQMPQPDYSALANALTARGFAVIVPGRPGHGATGGPYVEDQGGCDDANYDRAGRATAEAITAALAFMRKQDFIAKTPALLIGHSAGGFGALALAALSSNDIGAIVVFAPGRGGHAGNRPGAICAPERLIATAKDFGRGARVPVTWLVAENDSYFPPDFSRRMADAFRAGGGKLDFRILPAFGKDGHWLAELADARILEDSLRPLSGALRPK